MSLDEDYEPTPPLPWVTVANRIRALKQASASTASFVHSIQVVLDEMGYEVRKARTVKSPKRRKPLRPRTDDGQEK